MSKMGCPQSDTDPDSVTILTKRGPVNKTLKSNSRNNILHHLNPPPKVRTMALSKEGGTKQILYRKDRNWIRRA
ncbi:hypothetical protein NECAME_05088 [Necator americanus]|uniref:Uncharacterized protein n=1 Tax=Necator americanus TaxID=51031 RepID=W2SMG1_NECAM|nr:hypothetical protein NECAME_05088 [Necator americanus]ETN69902.1 hypothetical protein NECAME_05088 [Necator americanus]